MCGDRANQRSFRAESDGTDHKLLGVSVHRAGRVVCRGESDHAGHVVGHDLRLWWYRALRRQ